MKPSNVHLEVVSDTIRRHERLICKKIYSSVAESISYFVNNLEVRPPLFWKGKIYTMIYSDQVYEFDEVLEKGFTARQVAIRVIDSCDDDLGRLDGAIAFFEKVVSFLKKHKSKSNPA